MPYCLKCLQVKSLQDQIHTVLRRYIAIVDPKNPDSLYMYDIELSLILNKVMVYKEKLRNMIFVVF